MARPKPTLLTIPQELRNKIYGYALELPEEFQVCECPEIFSNELGLCDLIKENMAYDSSDTICHPSRTPKNPKMLLNLICKQTADELKDTYVRLPTLVFCSARCVDNFMDSLSLPHNHYTMSRVHIWAVKIKTCANAWDDADGTVTWYVMMGLNEADEDPSLMKRHSLKFVSRKDTGDEDLDVIRVVKLYFENDDDYPYLQKLIENRKLWREEVRTVSTITAGVNGSTAAVKKGETDEQDKEEKTYAESNASGVSKPLTESAK